MKSTIKLYAGLGLAAMMLLWYVKENAKKIAGEVPQIVADVVAGGVVGIGEVIGIPATDQDECARAMAEGRTWDASFVCPIGTFGKYLVGQ